MGIEIWKDVPEFEGYYQVSSLGNVKGLDRVIDDKRWGKSFVTGRELKQQKDRYGYMKVVLQKDGNRYYRTVHRIVAKTFIPNDSLKPDVNHKNGVKTDNRVENLEWCNASENQIHAIKLGLVKKDKNLGNNPMARQIVYTNGFITKMFFSLKEASIKQNIPLTRLQHYLNGKKVDKNISWRYL